MMLCYSKFRRKFQNVTPKFTPEFGMVEGKLYFCGV